MITYIFTLLCCNFNFLDEAKREKEFYHSKGLACPKDIIQNNDQIDVKKAPDEVVNDVDLHRYDEQVIKLIFILSESSCHILGFFFRLTFAWSVELSSYYSFKEDF